MRVEGADRMARSATAGALALACALCGAFAATVPDGACIVPVGSVNEVFVPVAGTSRLPLEFMRSGVDREKCSPVELPPFWIARRDVTEGEFAEVMGRSVRSGRAADGPATGIGWIDAVRFCAKLNELNAGRMPVGHRLELPTMLEWAHAARCVGKDSCELMTRPGKMLFTGGIDGGFLHTLGGYCERFDWARGRDAAIDYLCLGKHRRSDDVGLRLVLVADDAIELGDHVATTRGAVLLGAGYVDEALAVFARAAECEILTEAQRGRLARIREQAEKMRSKWHEDWEGLMLAAAEALRQRGYAADGILSDWTDVESARANAFARAMDSYRKAGIAGVMTPIGELPAEIRHDQPEGGERMLLLPDEGGGVFEHRVPVTERTKVAVLSCDFTGDGRSDMVVEVFGAQTPRGALFRFYERTEYNRYKSVGEAVACAGLCAVPRASGGACGFLAIGTESDGTLSLSLMTCAGGRMDSRALCGKSFRMLDARDDEVYRPVPYIGAGRGRGWLLLESRGERCLPLFWPWKTGELEGYAEAVAARAAKRAAGARKEAAK